VANFAKFIEADAAKIQRSYRYRKFDLEICPVSEQNNPLRLLAVALALLMWSALNVFFAYVASVIVCLTYQNVPADARPMTALIVFAAIAALCFGQFVRLASRRTGNGGLSDIGQHIASALFGLVAGAFGSVIYLLSYHRAFFANAIYISDIASATADFVLKAMAVAAVVAAVAYMAKRSGDK
jgi:hypothetical protein